MDTKIKKVFRVHVSDTGDYQKQLIAKYMLEAGRFHILEDHADMFLGDPNGGVVTPDLQAKLDGLENSSYYQTQDVDSLDHYLESLPESTIGDLAHIHSEMERLHPEVQFNLARDGKLYRLVFNGNTGQYTLNNSSISGPELEALVEEIRVQRAVLEAI